MRRDTLQSLASAALVLFLIGVFCAVFSAAGLVIRRSVSQAFPAAASAPR